MHKKIVFLILLLMVPFYQAIAQKKILEGSVKYKVIYDLPADQSANLPSEITCYFRGDSCAAISNQGSAIVKGVSVFKTNYHSLLIDIPAALKKILVVMTAGEVEQEKAEVPVLKGKKGTDKQVIAGYHCFKIIASDEKSGVIYDVWVTNDLDMPPNSVSKPVSGFGGVPIKFVTFNRGIKINAEVSEIQETAVPPGFFTATKDYEIMSFTELKALTENGK